MIKEKENSTNNPHLTVLSPICYATTHACFFMIFLNISFFSLYLLTNERKSCQPPPTRSHCRFRLRHLSLSSLLFSLFYSSQPYNTSCECFAGFYLLHPVPAPKSSGAIILIRLTTPAFNFVYPLTSSLKPSNYLPFRIVNTQQNHSFLVHDNTHYPNLS